MSGASPRLRGLILTLTERCNLRCDYCYVPVERCRTMSRQTADAAVACFAANAAEEGPLGLSFFGGEPFLARQEMRRIVDDARTAIGPDRRLQVLTPTNALALCADDAAWCRREGIELAVSIDGTGEVRGRRYADGRPVSGDLAAAVPELLRALPPGTAMARMTVTPANVGNLCANVRALSRLGFERIVYLPDHLAVWDDVALGLWRREHERLASWLIGAKSAGRAVPDLPAWRAVEDRLRKGACRGHCGAGVDQVTVSPEGDLYPCYRFAYAGTAEAWRLGNVRDGFTEPQRLAKLRDLHPRNLRPERRSCAACSAKDGCTHFCPALGLLASQDVAGVPEVACRLMEAQVDSVRELCRRSRRPARAATTSPSWAAAAVMVAALAGASACGSSAATQPDGGRDAGIDTPPADAVGASLSEGGIVDGDQPEQPIYVGGLCPVLLPDRGPTGGGIC